MRSSALWGIAVALTLVMFASNAAAQSSCDDGQAVGPDTAGHCCWPRQVWSNSRSACVGLPQCPSGFEAVGESCRRTCPQGQSVGPDTRGHCCWPDQAWSESRSTCVGVPSCPPSFRAEGERCVPAAGATTGASATASAGATVGPSDASASCTEGHVAVSGHCCWPAQRWDEATNSCAGPPRCPQGFAALGESCMRRGPEPIRRSGESTTQGTGAVAGTGTAPTTAAVSPGGCGVGQVAFDGHCCWPAQTWDAATNSCAGRPACPSGFAPLGESCMRQAGAPIASTGTPAVGTPAIDPVTGAPVGPAAPSPAGGVPIDFVGDENVNGDIEVRGAAPPQRCTLPCRMSVTPGRNHFTLSGPRQYEIDIDMPAVPSRGTVHVRNNGLLGGGIALGIGGFGLLIGGEVMALTAGRNEGNKVLGYALLGVGGAIALTGVLMVLLPTGNTVRFQPATAVGARRRGPRLDGLGIAVDGSSGGVSATITF